jgi:hypothetical protein
MVCIRGGKALGDLFVARSVCTGGGPGQDEGESRNEEFHARMEEKK